jgi:hypothetical protein
MPEPLGSCARFDARCVRFVALLVNPSRAPAASANLSSIEELTNPVEPRGEAFHDALDLLQVGGRGRNRCERYLLEPTHPHQASDTPVASLKVNKPVVAETRASPFGEAEDRLRVSLVKGWRGCGRGSLPSLGHPLTSDAHAPVAREGRFDGRGGGT